MDESRLDELVDELCAAGVLDHDPETDLLTTTDAFEGDRHVYYDTYLSLDEDEYHQSVAEAFDLPSAEAAAERVDRLDVNREEFATYMALYARLDGYSTETLATMAGIVVEVGPDSPVPDAVTELDDESYGEFLAANDRAVVTVWKRNCAPCEGMKSELDEILAGLPEGVVVGGLDGEQCPGFCREYEVNAAPAVAFFEDGDLLDVVTGRTSPDPLAERAASLYGTA